MKKSSITLGPLLQLEGHTPDGVKRTMDFGSGRTRGLILAHDELLKMELVYPRQTKQIATRRCEPLADTYTALHEGAAVDACFEDLPRRPHGRTKVVLVHDAITYKKRTDEPDPIPPYRHKYELDEHEKPTLLIDERGEYFVGNQRWITVTEGGIEDRGSRANPSRRLVSLVDHWWAR
jgi:hypothetical protein